MSERALYDKDMLTVDVANSIVEVPRDAWNAMAVGLYSSHEWLTAVESEVDGRCEYVLAWDGAELVAGLPVYLVRLSGDDLYRPVNHLDRFTSGLSSGVNCLAGSVRGYRNDLLVAPGLAAPVRREALRLVVGRAHRSCIEASGGSLPFLFLTGPAAAELRELDGVSEPVPCYGAGSRIETVGDSFDGYLARLTATRRKTTNKELRRFAAAGLTVELEYPWDHCELVARLIGNLNRKYGRVLPHERYLALLDCQRAALGDGARLFVCRLAGEPVGVTMGYVWGRWLYLWFVGFDYDRLPGAYEYFNLNIYQPMQYCYAEGLAGLDLGVGTHHAKGARGASVEPLFAAAYSPDPAERDGVVSSARRSKVARYWQAERARTMRAFAPALWNPLMPR